MRALREAPAPVDGADSEVLASLDGQQPWGKFHLATVMFRRVVQLRAGAHPRIDTDGHKNCEIAYREIMAGTIPWEEERS